MILWQDDEEDDDNEDTEDEIQNRNARKMKANKHMTHIRHKRGILDESSINFPPDAALMSINFLTFAVFLIKLVLVRRKFVNLGYFLIKEFVFDFSKWSILLKQNIINFHQ